MTPSPTHAKGRDDTNLHNRLGELRDEAGIVTEGVRAMAATGKHMATDQLDSLESYIKERPMKSLLVAAGIGALFGFFFLRR